jgi:uncharacterized lipoprotein YddW (UPF0748 family)
MSDFNKSSLTRRHFLRLGTAGLTAVLTGEALTSHAAERPRRKVAATVLDFYDTLASAHKLTWSSQDTQGWYNKIGDTGFDTVYLRMSNGRAYWPSRVLLMYTDDGRNQYSAALAKVCRQRDLLKEFVTLAHKNGKKAIYWIPIYDDETTLTNYLNNADKAKKYGLFPFQSILGKKHPQFYWEYRHAWLYPRDRDRPGHFLSNPSRARRWWGGCPEYLYPGARKYRLDLCREVVERYAMDGICYSLRSHSWLGTEAEDASALRAYGFNQPVVDEYKKRYGVNIRTQDWDFKKAAQIRGEGLTRLVRETYQYMKGKGKEFHMMVNPGPGLGVDNMPFMREQKIMFWNKVDLDWRTWVKNGWLHAVVLYGTWVRDRYGKPWQTVAEKIRTAIGKQNIPMYMFYRLKGPAESAAPLREDLGRMFRDRNLDGVVVYESDDFTWNDPKDANNLLKVLKQAFSHR